LKIRYAVLVAGAILLGSGILLFMSISGTIDTELSNTALILQDVAIEPGSYQAVEVTMQQTDQVFVGVSIIPSNIPMVLIVEDSDGKKILESAFDTGTIKELKSVTAGKYVISITNLGEKSTDVYLALTNDPFLGDITQMESFAYSFMAFVLLILFGIAVLIVGGIMTIRTRLSKKT